MTDDQIIAIARDLGWHTQIDEIRDNAVELARAIIEAYQRLPVPLDYSAHDERYVNGWNDCRAEMIKRRAEG